MKLRTCAAHAVAQVRRPIHWYRWPCAGDFDGDCCCQWCLAEESWIITAERIDHRYHQQLKEVQRIWTFRE